MLVPLLAVIAHVSLCVLAASSSSMIVLQSSTGVFHMANTAAAEPSHEGHCCCMPFLVGLQLHAVCICTHRGRMHSKLLRACRADTTNAQVMYLRSDDAAIAMGEIKTAAERPSDNLLNPASPSNFLQTYQADTQPGAVISGSGSKQLPKYVNSKSCQQIRARYTAMQVMNICTVFVAECRLA